MSDKDIIDRLEKIENVLRILVDKVDKLDKSCSRMDTHINFVEDTYEGLKYPLKVIKHKVESVFGKERSITHESEDKDDIV